MKENTHKGENLLYECILALDTADEIKNFFEDLFTIQELNAVFQRLEVAKILRDGATYNTVAAETGASTATISRVNRSLSYGTGGYDHVFKKLKEKSKNE